jgi:6-phosphogluconolactonase/glucosamine-6-phosphate isomerase/deaminase
VLSGGTTPPPLYEQLAATGNIDWSHVEVFWFWIAGAGKAERLAEVAAEIDRAAPVFPAARVVPAGGGLVWFVDAAAALQL